MYIIQKYLVSDGLVLKKALFEKSYSVKIQFHENLSPLLLWMQESLFAASALPLDKAKTVLCDLSRAACLAVKVYFSASLEIRAALSANELFSMQDKRATSFRFYTKLARKHP